MTELKTLKDLNEKDIVFLQSLEPERKEGILKEIKEVLKQEAIREIKELIRTKEFLEIFGCDVEPLIEYIKWKNNVEEEDLKDE